MSEFSENSKAFLHRTEILFGADAMQKLASCHVLLAGAGGVGGYAAEALARGGIRALTVYDPDSVHPTNLNRQILALHSTCGKLKTDCLYSRLADINPQLELNLHPEALTAENIPSVLDSNNFDYVIDAIDPINEKCFLLAACYNRKIPVISAMGAGCRLDPSQVKYADISKTNNCRLAKSVRSKLKKEYGITGGIECVYSSEPPIPEAVLAETPNSRPTIGSSSFMPGIFGLFLAGRVLCKLAGKM